MGEEKEEPTVKAEPLEVLQDKRDEELRQLAVDITEQKVFASWMFNEAEARNILPSVFMVVALGAQIPRNVQHLYEYYSEAGPRSVNGYPIFFSAKMLTENDCKKLQPLLTELAEQKKKFLNLP